MKEISAGYQIIQDSDALKKIEKIARVCYKSEDKISDGSDKIMFKNLLNRNHTAMIEHASLAYIVPEGLYKELQKKVKKLYSVRTSNSAIKDEHRNYLRFSKYTLPNGRVRFIVSGNLRAWLQTFQLIMEAYNWLPISILNSLALETKEQIVFDLPKVVGSYPAMLVKDYLDLAPQERLIHEDLSVLFTVDRGVTHELVRMRECSFAQESTRYCNYSNGKFGNEITCVTPCFWADKETSPQYALWRGACEEAEKAYFALMQMEGVKPQEARDVLPQSVKAEITMTAPLGEWYHIFALRACDSTGPAHPQMKEVMVPLLKEVKNNPYFGGIFDNLVIPE